MSFTYKSSNNKYTEVREPERRDYFLFKKNRALRSVLSAFFVIWLPGCAAFTHYNTSKNISDHSTAEVVLVDAKQRAIISSKSGTKVTEVKAGVETSKTTVNHKICAEPSPDAISALAASAGLQLSKQDAIDFAANLAMSEGAASIGLRTQSIQLMRDAMYRMCEGYLSGALSAVAFETLHRRTQSSMVAILAIEQLTGVVRAKTVVLTGDAVIGSAELVAKYTEQTVTARSALTKAKAAETESEKKLGEAKSARAALKTEEVTKNSEIEGLQAEVGVTTKAVQDKEEELAKLALSISAAETAGDATEVTKLQAEQKEKNIELVELNDKDKVSKEGLAKAQEELTAFKPKIEQAAATELAAEEKLKESKANREAREQEVETYDKARIAAQQGTATAKTSGMIDAGQGSQNVNKDTVNVIAQNVYKIVAETLELNFSRELCVSVLASLDPNIAVVDNSLGQKCLAYLDASTGLVTAKINQIDVQNRLLVQLANSGDISPATVEAITRMIEAQNEADMGGMVPMKSVDLDQ